MNNEESKEKKPEATGKSDGPRLKSEWSDAIEEEKKEPI
jgi:hypothetical protein